MPADTSDSDKCISVSFNLFQSYEKSHISMMAHLPEATHCFCRNFLITTLQTDVLQSTFSTKVNVIKNLKQSQDNSSFNFQKKYNKQYCVEI